MITRTIPVISPIEQQLLIEEFRQLSAEEKDLFFEAYCRYCGKRLEELEYGSNHLCASLQMLRAYYKQEEFWIGQKIESEIWINEFRFEIW